MASTKDGLQTLREAYDDTLGGFKVSLLGSMVPKDYDYVAYTYVAAGNGTGEVSTAVYKTGGSGGTTVATLTYAYDSSNRVSSITRT